MSWIDGDPVPFDDLDSLPGVLWHLTDAWTCRTLDNVVLIHYSDLLADLDGQMRRLADRLGSTVASADWSTVVAAATFDQMRARADHLAPDTAGVLRSPTAFFRAGTSGSGAAVLTPAQLEHYDRRAAALAPADLRSWLHR